jgi:hypothetical protein
MVQSTRVVRVARRPQRTMRVEAPLNQDVPLNVVTPSDAAPAPEGAHVRFSLSTLPPISFALTIMFVRFRVTTSSHQCASPLNTAALRSLAHLAVSARCQLHQLAHGRTFSPQYQPQTPIHQRARPCAHRMRLFRIPHPQRISFKVLSLRMIELISKRQL